MKQQKIFSILVLTGLLIIASASARAQNGGAAELKKRIFEQMASGAKGRVAEKVVQPDTQAFELAAIQASDALANFPKKNALVGTWDVTSTFSDGGQARSTLQIMPGAAEGQGNVLHASEFSLTLPNPTLPEQGVWEYSGNQFIASYRGYAFTENFEPFGFIGFRHAITVSANQESFTGRAVFEVFDATGQVLFSTTCQTRGVRQHAVAP
jgi:hypothetical protein